MTESRMTEVLFLEGYRLNILLNSGQRIIFDLGPKLITARFQELQEWEDFVEGHLVDGRRICWATGAELTLDEILLNLDLICK